MSHPIISVVIAAYNAEKYLAETLASVRAQTFPDYEIVLVDDGSTDGTAALAALHEDVVIVRQSNRGEAAARNTGIRAARGEFVAFLDADDIWLPWKLEKQVDELMRSPQTGWVYSDALVFDSETRRTLCRIGERLHLYEGYILRQLLLQPFIPSATPVVRRSVLAETGWFNEARERRIGEDWGMWLRIAERHEVALIDEPLAMIRLHGGNMSRMADPWEGYRSKRAVLTDAMARNPEASAGLWLRAHTNIALSSGLRYLSRAVHHLPGCAQ